MLLYSPVYIYIGGGLFKKTYSAGRLYATVKHRFWNFTTEDNYRKYDQINRKVLLLMLCKIKDCSNYCKSAVYLSFQDWIIIFGSPFFNLNFIYSFMHRYIWWELFPKAPKGEKMSKSEDASKLEEEKSQDNSLM